MFNRLKLSKAAAAIGSVLAVLMVYTQLPRLQVQAQQADTASIVAAAAEILYNNEGGYDSVNANDNGALSIGRLQWHAGRALSLVQDIVLKNKEQAKKLLGSALYKEVTAASSSSAWAARKLTAAEAAAVKKLLLTEESKEVQDALAVTDITGYVQQAQRLGITNEPALVYFADLANQGGAGSAGRTAASASNFAGGYAAVTLNELHQAAICDSVMGKSDYLNRRYRTYIYAAQLGWTYCSKADSYIPSDYTSAKAEGAAWVQRSLNTCMKAGLSVSGVYDSSTKAAVKAFQGAQGLEKDGFAGKSTITALIKAVFTGKTITAPKPEDPGTEDPGTKDPGTEDPGTKDPGTEDPGTDTKDPALKSTVLSASKKSYAVNDTQKAFSLGVTSSRSKPSITYRSSNTKTAAVSSSGKVTVKGVGTAKITAEQAATDTYAAASLTISITVYSTNPADYEAPAGALYKGKNMQKAHVQWLQAALTVLDQASITVNGSWTDSLTKLVSAFQTKCGIASDGIAGTQTQALMKKMLSVKGKKPALTIKSSTKANVLAWTKYADADRVYIYRRETGGSYKRIKTITNMTKTSYQDTTAKKGVKYEYVIKYGCISNKARVLSPASKKVSGTVK